MRKALELSIITAPDATMVFAQALELDPPAEANTRSISLKESSLTASTVKDFP